MKSVSQQELEVRSVANAAFMQGKITAKERDYYIKQKLAQLQPALVASAPAPVITRREFHTEFSESSKPHHPRAKMALLVFFLLGFVSILFSGGGFTGLVTFDVENTTQVGQVFTASGSYIVPALNTTTLRVSGLLENGSANISFEKNNETYVVYAGSTTDVQGVWLYKETYRVNESIFVEILGGFADYSLWLTNAQGNKTLVTSPFTVKEIGEYEVESLVNASGVIAQYAQNFTVDIQGSNELLLPTLFFSEACQDTCVVEPTSNITLNIMLSEGATLRLDAITISSPRENTAPQQVTTIPTIVVNETTTFDLTGYFTDVDGDMLSYEINNIVGVEEDITANMLMLTGAVPGTYSGTIYASDGNAVTLSNTFNILVLDTQEEVEQVVPEVITSNIGKENLKAIDYGKLSGLLIEGVKELKTEKDIEIEALQEEITLLKETLCEMNPNASIC